MTSASLTLGDLFAEATGDDAARPVSGLAADSRRVGPGSVFAAVPGTRSDGSAFIAQAVASGAAAVVGEAPRPGDLPAEVAYLQSRDVRRSLALAAARAFPAQPDTIVAVTGTSGKSSVADFTRQLYAALGHKSGSVGTLGIVTSDGASYGSLTTPDPLSLHETLDRLAGEGVTRLAMEASSHGIDQRRLDGVRLKAAAFTNLGRDHLDYHRTLPEYLKAKLRLFDTLLPPDGVAVINADSPEGAEVRAVCQRHGRGVWTTGHAGRAIRLHQLRPVDFAQHLRLSVVLPGEQSRLVDAVLPLAGRFQVENALVAAGLVLATEGGGAVEPVFRAFASLKGVPGRLDPVGEVNGALCVVDYAHKPEALAHVLAALRPFATGRLVCVFGCGGDRDRGKRPLMGQIAVEKADIVIVTDDNPRSEEPATIRAEILAGAPDAREIGDRAEAIRTAVRGLQPGDVLVVAGKGHETGQIVGDRTHPFSDHDALREAMAEVTR